MESCIFCEILRGGIEASVVFQDEKVTALMDIQPINPGHLLIIPNKHATHLTELDEEIGAHLFRTGMRVAKALHSSGIRCEGVNFLLADGEAAGQEVLHVHLHVYPRFKGDGFGLRFGPEYNLKPSRASLDAIAEKIKASLSA